jgi:hypothetical protein
MTPAILTRFLQFIQATVATNKGCLQIASLQNTMISVFTTPSYTETASLTFLDATH